MGLLGLDSREKNIQQPRQPSRGAIVALPIVR
jgi:hypothetical protein